LGHPSPSIVQHVLKNNDLPFDERSNSASVCDACQKGKMHQLPYTISSSVSKVPLELVLFDVWGPVPESIGRFKYYVSFIDDFSKFTWIYLIKHKFEVFQCFHDFHNLVERLFDRKILAMQTDWGGEYHKLNTFFQRIGISHHISTNHDGVCTIVANAPAGSSNDPTWDGLDSNVQVQNSEENGVEMHEISADEEQSFGVGHKLDLGAVQGTSVLDPVPGDLQARRELASESVIGMEEEAAVRGSPSTVVRVSAHGIPGSSAVAPQHTS
jgi:hypothetical protein